MSEIQTDRHWHLDRRVPVALIMAIIVQTFGFGWWLSNLSSRVDAATNLAQQNRAANMELARKQGTMDTTLGRFDERLISIQEGVRRIEKSVSASPP